MKRNFLLPNNDQIICTHQAAIFTFSASRMVLSTVANLDNMVVLTKTWNSISITAAVSAGADVNALCAETLPHFLNLMKSPAFFLPALSIFFLSQTRHFLPVQ